MASVDNEVTHSFRLVAIVRAIIEEERKRAENAPLDQRYRSFNIVEANMSKKEARRAIDLFFAETSLLLEHLHVAHQASSFERGAKARIAAAIGEARNAIASDRNQRSKWPTRLVAKIDDFEGLASIATILDVPQTISRQFTKIKEIRNKFSHGDLLRSTPEVTPNETAIILSEALESLI